MTAHMMFDKKNFRFIPEIGGDAIAEFPLHVYKRHYGHEAVVIMSFCGDAV